MSSSARNVQSRGLGARFGGRAQKAKADVAPALPRSAQSFHNLSFGESVEISLCPSTSPLFFRWDFSCKDHAFSKLAHFPLWRGADGPRQSLWVGRCFRTAQCEGSTTHSACAHSQREFPVRGDPEGSLR